MIGRRFSEKLVELGLRRLGLQRNGRERRVKRRKWTMRKACWLRRAWRRAKEKEPLAARVAKPYEQAVMKSRRVAS